MIISASRRTDLPAFYTEWFMQRLRAGYCLVPNPYNPRQISRVSLELNDVDAIVFWTKNPAPLLPYVDELTARGYLYYFQYTLNDYPSALEPRVPLLERRIDSFLELSARLEPARIVWRYNRVLLTPRTDPDYHRAAFERIAQALQGATNRVMLSLAEPYRKTQRRLAGLAEPSLAVDWNAAPTQAAALMGDLAECARRRGIAAYSCADAHGWGTGLQPGRCIDGGLMASLGGQDVTKKDLGQRPACLCVRSRDIGVADTCAHGCVYCYASRDDAAALRRLAAHEPTAPMLFDASAALRKANAP